MLMECVAMLLCFRFSCSACLGVFCVFLFVLSQCFVFVVVVSGLSGILCLRIFNLRGCVLPRFI